MQRFVVRRDREEVRRRRFVVERRRKLQRREKVSRRRQIDPTTCERDYNDEEIIFMKAMDQYKRDNRRPFPTWSEVLEVLYAMGYRQVAEAIPIPGSPEYIAAKKKEE